ncbi:MAG: dihydrofolate reductase family protein [Sphingobacterium sp.]|jgi:dihydrofolate reductase|nr:dihydrofolate reductase family protein [Sphingobacterium sp.]
MRKVIAAFNMTLDALCDHTSGIPDEEIHKHYTDLLNQADVILYGRITYQLMEYWKPFINNPSGEKSMDDFALAIDKIPKIVFSNTLKNIEWESAKFARRELKEEILNLKRQPGEDILVGSRSLIIQLMKINLIDEFQLCVYPVIVGSGLSLFENINNRIILRLLKTKTFAGGSVILYYQPRIDD